jgi:hypothetical protein
MVSFTFKQEWRFSAEKTVYISGVSLGGNVVLKAKLKSL